MFASIYCMAVHHPESLEGSVTIFTYNGSMLPFDRCTRTDKILRGTDQGSVQADRRRLTEASKENLVVTQISLVDARIFSG